MYTGPNITNDSLIFGFDTGYGVADNNTSTIFYPGEPTTNYADDTVDAQGGWGGSYSLIDSATKKFRFNINNFNGSAGSGQGWRTFVWDMRAHTGSAVTISATIEIPDDSPGDFAWVMMGQANSGSNGTSAANYLGYSATSERYYKTTKNTERITWSGTIGNTGTANQPNGYIGFTVWYNGGTSGTNSYIDVSNIQIEKISHATPFVNGSRSNTASLIDLKQTRDINVSNMSFEGTGQPDFDGTDDFIAITDLLASQSIGVNTKLTISLWLNPDSHTSAMAFSTGQSGNDRIYFWTQNGLNTWRVNAYTSTTGHGSLPSIGNWFNTVLVINGLDITVYLNGVEDYTGTYTTFTTQNYATFGRHGATSSYYYNGNIAVARIYEKALSATEVLKDFNAHKKRFNI